MGVNGCHQPTWNCSLEKIWFGIWVVLHIKGKGGGGGGGGGAGLSTSMLRLAQLLLLTLYAGGVC